MSTFNRIWEWFAGILRRFGAWLEGRTASDSADGPTPQDGSQVVATPQFDLQNAEEPRYIKRRSLLTNPEAALFERLQKIVGRDYYVFPMVRLGDVMRLQNLPADRKYHNNQIMCKHFDFVFCHRTSLEPLLALELNDATHTLFDRRNSDDFKRKVCKEVGIPLVELVVGTRMTDEELRRVIATSLNPPVAGQQHSPG